MSTTTQPQAQQPKTELAKVPQTSPLITHLAAEWKLTTRTMIDTLKATIFPQKDNAGNAIVVSDAQMVAFLQVCDAYKLNPFVREIYAFPTKGGGIVPMVPVDGWSSIVNRRPEMDGLEFIDEWEMDERGGRASKIPFSTTCIIYRKDRSHPTKVTEYFEECNQPTKEPWKKWPARMLRHKAMIQCARIAFSLGGIVDPDEAERIDEGSTPGKAEVNRPQRVVEGTLATEARSASTSEPPQNGGVERATQVAKVAEVEDNRSNDIPASSDSPSSDEVGFKPDQSTKPAGPYASKQRVQKLCAVARAAGINVTDDHQDALHKMVLEKHNISSLNEIPESLYDEILKAAGGEALKIK